MHIRYSPNKEPVIGHCAHVVTSPCTETAYGCLNVDSIARHLTFWWTDIELPFWWCEIAYTTYCVINNAVISDSHRVEKFWITLRWTRHRIDVRIRFGHSKRLAPNHNQYPFYDNNFGTSKIFVVHRHRNRISSDINQFQIDAVFLQWNHHRCVMTSQWQTNVNILANVNKACLPKKTRMNKDFQICTFLFL